MFRDFINGFYVIVQLLFFTIGFYYFATSIFGLIEKLKAGTSKNFLPLKKFALFIPAHNEEVVIQDIVENLGHLNYPKDCYDIFVIADNCTDSTAEVAANAGAKVLERFNTEKRGKGHALEWAFEEVLYKKGADYDAMVVFDADNLVSKNFLKNMNNKMCEGYKVIQGYIDSKNPDDSWITACYSIAFWSANRLFQCGRSFMGMSNQIGGTGFCADVKVLKEVGWNTTCLVEDLEFTMKLNMNGIKVGWAHDAIVYDEKPLTLVQSWKQRKRWMQGYADVCSRYFFKLFAKAIKERSLSLLDCALYTLQPYVIILGGFILLLPFINNNLMGEEMFLLSATINPVAFKVFGLMQFLLVPISLHNDKKLNYKVFLYYPIYIFYCLTWIPIAIEGVICMKNQEWSHTLHTRRVTIHELE